MTSPRLLAEWQHRPSCSCSKTSLGCSLQASGKLWPESFTDWPASGMSARGGLYELPTSAHPTAANDGSASPGLLPTPSAGNFNDGEPLESWEARRQANLAKGINGNGQGTPLAIAAQQLLPTPTATDGQGGIRALPEKRTSRGKDHGGPRLRDISPALLRTPTAQLAVNGGSQHPGKRRAGGHGPTLANEVEHLLPTPDATHGRKWSRTAPQLPGAVELLPTPRATDGTKGDPNQHGSSGDLMLPSAVMDLLPTPRAARGGSGTETMYALGGERTDEGRPQGEVLLPTPTVADSRNSRNATAGRSPGSAAHSGTTLSDTARLLPTPRVSATRTSRTAATRADSCSAPSLEQAMELAAGILPRELESLNEAPPSWRGERTSQLSEGGKPSSDGQLPGQLSLDELESA